MQEQIDHKNHQQNCNQESHDDLLHAFCYRECLVERNGVIDVLGEALLHLRHELPDALDSLDSVGAGQLVDGKAGCRLAIQATDHAVILRAQLRSGHVFNTNSPSIRCFAHDNVAELFWRGQSPLSQHGIRELLVTLSWLAANLSGRIDGVLGFNRANDVGDRDTQLR